MKKIKMFYILLLSLLLISCKSLEVKEPKVVADKGEKIAQVKIKEVKKNSRIINFKNLEEIDNKYYIEDRIANGRVEAYYEDGSLKARGKLEDGKLKGNFIVYYQDTTKNIEAYFRDGKLDGIQRYYYENGVVRKVEYYINGVLNGKVESYYEDGTLKSSVDYVDGRVVGEIIYKGR